MPEFTAPLADARNYPPPRFSMLASDPLAGGIAPGIAGVGAAYPAPRARAGLAQLARAVLPPGARVLLPAYHCPALVEPFVWAGCEIAFYPMTTALDPDWEAFGEQLPRCDAMVLVRYFGFDNAIAGHALRARNHGLLVIEDLAHAFFASALYGDYGVTSAPKFLPLDRGAEVLVAETIAGQSLPQCLPAGAGGTLQRFVTGLQYRLSGRRPAPGFRYFHPAMLGERVHAGAVAQQRTHAGAAREQRRANADLLLSQLAACTAGRLLYPQVSPAETPYVIPFLLADAEDFHRIRGDGVPLYRWEEIATSDCVVSADYRHRLIQLPCHQDLSTADIAFMVQCLNSLQAGG